MALVFVLCCLLWWAHARREALGVGLFVNLTESLEPGLYVGMRGTTPSFDQLVIVHPPQQAFRWGCVNKGQLLLKEVVALPGDEVCLKGQGELWVKGHFYSLSASHGVSGAPMPPAFFTGCIQVPRGRVFVATRHPQSCDSRLFGPLPSSSIWGQAWGPLF